MKITIGPRILGCLGVLVMAGCATTSPPAPAHDPPGEIVTTAGALRTCPLGLTGTAVAIVDTPEGVDISFTTKGNVDELRRRVRDQAANYGPGSHRGLGHGGMHSGAQTHGLRLSELPSIETRVQDIDGGARLNVMTTDIAARPRVRSELHERAAQIVAVGECP